MLISDIKTLNTLHDTCTGCGACKHSCPAGAISMKPDMEGFIRPEVNIQKCIHCGLCNKVCPVSEEKKTGEQLDVKLNISSVEYIKEQEEKLKELIEKIDGAGETEVMITLESCYENVYYIYQFSRWGI